MGGAGLGIGRYNYPIPVFEAQDYMACDGKTDDSADFNALALNAGSQYPHGAVIRFPPGDIILQGGLLQSNLVLEGAGSALTRLLLPPGANQSLLWGGSANAALINVIDQNQGDGSAGGLNKWQLRHLTLDGAKLSQSSGTSYCLQVYGYGYTLEDVVMQNGFTGGAILDWNGGSNSPAGSDSMISRIDNFIIHNNNGIGLIWGGPHDSQIAHTTIWQTGLENMYIGPHAGGTHVTSSHFFQPETSGANTAPAVLCEGTTYFSNCQIEGSDMAQVVLLASGCSIIGGSIYSTNALAGIGIQIGQQAGDTPFAGSSFQSAGLATAVAPQKNTINTQLRDCPNAHGFIWFRNDGGANNIDLQMASSGSATTLFGGIPNTATSFSVNQNGFAAGGASAPFAIFPGSIAWRQQGSPVAINNLATIAWGPYGEALVAPTGNVTGIVIQTGSYPGQKLSIINESAFTVTFAASGTSNVADGVNCVIAALSARLFTWNAHTSLWYPVAGGTV